MDGDFCVKFIVIGGGWMEELARIPGLLKGCNCYTLLRQPKPKFDMPSRITQL
jgi:hypothetical protein